MIRIRITEACTARLTFAPGDLLSLTDVGPDVEAFLKSTRVDGKHVAVVVRGRDEQAIMADDETAVTARTRRSSAA